jgi:uncharacterized tellurite resistance protein B-like protein
MVHLESLNTIDQFNAFLLIHASYADLDFSESEKTSILKLVDEDTFKKVNHLYDSLGDYQRLDMIVTYRPKHYPTPESKKELMKLITKQFTADGEISKLESTLYQFLIRLL